MNHDNLEPMDLAPIDDDLPAEYDDAVLRDLLKHGVRGKYVDRYEQGTNLIKLDPDMAAAFPTEAAVNNALRQFLQDQQLPA
jgi:hypothetical protein